MGIIKKNREATQDNNQSFIAFICKGESVIISKNDIMYIEQCGAKLIIHQTDKEIMVNGRIGAISDVLGEPFVQCHAYLIVNFSNIESMAKRMIVFKNAISKELGRDSFFKIRKSFNQYIAKTSKIIQ